MIKLENGNYEVTQEDVNGFKKHFMNEYIQEMNKKLIKNTTTQCPCCKGKIGYYKRPINDGQFYFLIELFIQYKITGNVWHFYNKIQDSVLKKQHKKCTDYTKLKDWGLIASKNELDDDGKSSGFFSITKKGVKFLNGDISIPKYITTSNKGVILSTSDEMVTVDDFYESFSLTELLNNKDYIPTL